MTKDELISSILSSTAANAAGARLHSHVWLQSMELDELQTMQAELDTLAAFGRVHTPAPTIEPDVVEAILAKSGEAMKAWRAAVSDWSPTADQTAGHLRKLAPTLNYWSADAFRSRLVKARPTDLLARSLIGYIFDTLAAGRHEASEILQMQDRCELVISEYLDLELPKITFGAVQILKHLVRQQSVGHAIDLDVLTSLSDQWQVHQHAQFLERSDKFGEPVIVEGLARATACYRLFKPDVVVGPPDRQVLAGFLNSSETWLGRRRQEAAVEATPRSPQRILLAVDSADDADMLHELVMDTKARHSRASVIALCLFGSASFRRATASGSVFTVMVAPDDQVKTPWDREGIFTIDGTRLIFGANDRDRPTFSVRAEVIKQSYKRIEEAPPIVPV